MQYGHARGSKRIRDMMAELAEYASNKVERYGISTPDEAAAYMFEHVQECERERMWVIILDTRNHVLGVHEVYKGSVNSIGVRMAEFFREAVRLNGAQIMLVHNHPSGAPAPSPEDVSVTRAAVEAGRLLDIGVLDHIVLGASGSFVSMRAKGLGF